MLKGQHQGILMNNYWHHSYGSVANAAKKTAMGNLAVGIAPRS